MAELQVSADLGVDNFNIHIQLSLVEFIEDKVYIIYSPALDLTGSGYTSEEAHKSFSEALEEFARYTTVKKTTAKVLRQLGWSIKGSKKKPRYSPPKDSDLVSSNPLYNEIINNKSYTLSRENIALAI